MSSNQFRCCASAFLLFLSELAGAAWAHDADGKPHSHGPYAARPVQVLPIVMQKKSKPKTADSKGKTARGDALGGVGPLEELQALFAPFQPSVKIHVDDRWLFVESNGFPEHRPMVGITNWQQQVPLPQNYTGDNAWRIPLQPRLAERPISAKTQLRRGAIALAVNGIPIFNALNNRGEDAFQIGELDEFGGHCGRGDDYHYHIAPLHLQKIVGDERPIAFALDGFPIYGLNEPDGSPVRNLDEYNGHIDSNGRYHYHATESYPYINGGMRGVVEVRDDQVEPQPRDTPVRPAGRPLRGARITGFESTADNAWKLEYEVAGKSAAIEYSLSKQGQAIFTFIDTDGRRRTEKYERRERPARPKREDDNKKKRPAR